MSTKGIADVVFCIDASKSMKPCIDGIRANLGSFMDGLKSDRQVVWDLRMDYLAHRATGEGLRRLFDMRSLFYSSNENVCWAALYKDTQGGGRFFTSSADDFREGLKQIDVRGDEAALVGLDFALDFPWRDAAQCHRIVIMLTDEPLEKGIAVEWQTGKLSEIIEKIQHLKVMLFLVAPESDGFATLCEADKSEYQVVSGLRDGLESVDFRKVLSYIGKSVSKSTVQQSAPISVTRGVFGQGGWGTSEADFRGE